jgi:hypothetical protein
MKFLRSIINWELWQQLNAKDRIITTEYTFKKERNKMKTIEVCVGVGLNQFFPEYVTIEIPQEKKPRKKVAPKSEKEISVDSQKVVKPRKKSKGDTE